MKDHYIGSDQLNELTLGKETQYCDTYKPELLQGVPRALNRAHLKLDDKNELPFKGQDLWTGYELSWLNSKGKPQVAIAEFTVPITSANLIESKSFKLYLNSFNQSKFDHWDAVKQHLEEDLSHCAKAPVTVLLFDVKQTAPFAISELPGLCLDELDINIEQYDYDPTLLSLVDENDDVAEILHSHLLKSNCLITNQPDWASIVISYSGKPIDHASLLKYLISFRTHNEFHEQCVERIYTDIMNCCSPDKLSVYARYTRRGGLDINPFRSSDVDLIPYKLRLNRQ